MISIIACVGKNLELGKKGGLCFKIPEDMKFFRETTTGHSVLMGLSTWHSLPGKLRDRKHYVLSFDENEVLPDGVEVVTNLPKFLESWRGKKDKLFIIGGGSVYKQTIEFADELFLTEVEATDKEADVFFPKFNQKSWRRTEIFNQTSERPAFKIIHYEKIKQKDSL